ncbi:hypothetical protein K439DRAFT_1612407 [Ramaria rubella]|nr:hypothetical protein K439DRAFT_1612407 [Ramaria rubella]
MAYYTALSRSSNLDGTVIFQGFDEHKITKGTSGWLRQEFRELEILDDVTALNHQGKLDPHVEGDQRNTVIREYQLWKGMEHVPSNVHRALKWNKDDPLHLLEKLEDETWTIIDNKLKKAANITLQEHSMEGKSAKRLRLDEQNYVTAKGSQSLTTLSNDNGRLNHKCSPLMLNGALSTKKHKNKELDSNVTLKKKKTVPRGKWLQYHQA